MSTKHAQVSSEGSKSCRGVVPQYCGNEQQQRVLLWRTPGQFETGDDEGEDDDDDNSDRTTSTTAGGDHQYSQLGEAAERGSYSEAEPMFEKPLTPSDVGKLNRLVIPKQYAERYLPIAAAATGGAVDSKALHLCFEDECGKPWRFRYSYWNSSQSYVLTKGWSRYVKEKRLDAGDVVSFHRRPGDHGLSIRWRRRCIPTGPDLPGRASAGSTVSWAPQLPAARLAAQYPSHTSLVYVSDDQEHRSPLRDRAGEQMLAAKTTTPPPANSKRLRLFGVNLDCPSEDHLMPNPTNLDGSHHWTQTQVHRTPALFHDSTSHSL